MTKLTDEEAHQLLVQVAFGRSARDLAPMTHAAHEEVLMTAERQKHADLVSARVKGGKSTATASTPAALDTAGWDQLEANLLDGEGTNHVDIAVGAVLVALFARDTDELDFASNGLIKAALRTFPHVRQEIESQVRPPAPAKQKG